MTQTDPVPSKDLVWLLRTAYADGRESLPLEAADEIERLENHILTRPPLNVTATNEQIDGLLDALGHDPESSRDYDIVRRWLAAMRAAQPSASADLAGVIRELRDHGYHDWATRVEHIERQLDVTPSAYMVEFENGDIELHPAVGNPPSVGETVTPLYAGAAQPPAFESCQCDAHEWRPDYVEIRDSRGGLHYADKPCLPQPPRDGL